MAKFNSFLSDRFKKSKPKNEGETALAETPISRDILGGSGIFKITDLSEMEKAELKNLLSAYSEENVSIDADLSELVQITSEVKTINDQAIILHGERIKKAQTILKKYKDGAFTAWLINTYGNRQTPYNFLQYYEFYKNLTPNLREKMGEMPKQAIYTLASREGSMEKKQELVEMYQGESKKDVLDRIRTVFPLDIQDKRQSNLSSLVVRSLQKLLSQCKSDRFSPSLEEKQEIEKLLSQLKAVL